MDSFEETRDSINLIILQADEVLTRPVGAELGESPEAWRGAGIATGLFIEMISQQLETLTAIDEDQPNTPQEAAWNRWVQAVIGALFSLRKACDKMLPEQDG